MYKCLALILDSFLGHLFGAGGANKKGLNSFNPESNPDILYL
jgi:hypothetical protein